MGTRDSYHATIFFNKLGLAFALVWEPNTCFENKIKYKYQKKATTEKEFIFTEVK